MAENRDNSCAHNDFLPEEELSNDDEKPQKIHDEDRTVDPPSRSAQKKLLKLQRYEAKKAHQKAMTKQKKQREIERKRQEWTNKLASLSEEERSNLVQAKLDTRKERMGQRLEERERTREKLKNAMQSGQNIVVDLEFCDLMNPNEISSLVQQIMYCYAANRKSALPAHLWLTGCKGEIKSRLQKVPGFDNWLVEKEERSYIKALEERREDLVYLTADSEDVLQELETSKIYVIGGLVDRNR